MDNKLVTRCFFVFILLVMLMGSCTPAPLAISTVTSPSTAMPTSMPTASATPAPSLTPAPPAKPTITHLPTTYFSSLPDELDWPIRDVQGLKQQLKEAPVIVARIGKFLYCPPAYGDRSKVQVQIDSEVCADLELRLNEQQRQSLIDAIDENEIQAGEIPDDLRGGGSPLFAPPPEFSLYFVLPKFRLWLGWTTERSFNVGQTYYSNLPLDVWYPFYEENQGDGSIGFVQEKPALYQAVKALLPDIAFPPEHPAWLLAYERTVVEYDGKKCAYGNDVYPSFKNLIYGLLYTFSFTREPRPSGAPRAVFTFWVRGQVYTLEFWKNNKFFYQGKTYKYIPQPYGPLGSPYIEPQPSSDLEDFLLNLTQFTECKAP